MKEREKQLGEFALSLRIWTLKDKDSYFRAKEPDMHIVEIWANDRIMIRDFGFATAKEAQAHFNHLLSLFGYQASVRKEKK